MTHSQGLLRAILCAALLVSSAPPARAVEAIPVLIHHRAAARLAEIYLVIAAGRGHERPGDGGAASIAAASFLNGARPPSAEPVLARLAHLGVQASVSVSWAHTIVEFAVLAEHTPQAIGILAEMIAEPPTRQSYARQTFHQAALYRAMARDAVYQAGVLLQEALWERVPQAQKIPAILAHDLSARAFADALYRPTRMVLAIQGGFDRGEVVTALSDLQRRLRRADRPAGVPEFPAALRPARPAPMRCLLIDGLERPILTVGQAVEVQSDRDFVAIHLLAQALGGSPSSALQQRARADELAYTVAVTLEPISRSAVMLVAQAATERPERLRRAFFDALDAAAGPLEASTFAAAKAVLRSRLVMETGRPKAALIERALSLLFGWPPRDTALVDILEQLDRRSFRRIAHELLDPAARTTVLVAGRRRSACHNPRRPMP